MSIEYKHTCVVYDEISIFKIKLGIDYSLYSYCIYIFNNNASHLQNCTNICNYSHHTVIMNQNHNMWNRNIFEIYPGYARDVSILRAQTSCKYILEYIIQLFASISITKLRSTWKHNWFINSLYICLKINHIINVIFQHNYNISSIQSRLSW